MSFKSFLASRGGFTIQSPTAVAGINFVWREMYENYGLVEQTTYATNYNDGDPVPKFSFTVADGIVHQTEPNNEFLKIAYSDPRLSYLKTEYDAAIYLAATFPDVPPDGLTDAEYIANFIAARSIFNQLKNYIGL